MQVEELMTDAKCCAEGDSVRSCAQLMRDEDIGFLPVCNDAGEPIGAVTDRDLTIRVLAEGAPADERVSRFMTRDVFSCRIGDDVDEAERVMRQHQTSRVMICDELGRLRGVISLADLADVESDDELGETIQHVKSETSQPSAH